MAKVYLISESYIKTNTSVNLNVEEGLFDNSIIDAQEIHLQALLGTHLYLKVVSDVASNSVSGVYKTLLEDYCQKVVCYWALYESLPFMRFKIMNKGIQTQNSENSVTPELLEFQYLTEQIKNKAEFYSQRLIEYLKTQTSLVFPELMQNKDYDDMQPQSIGFDTGIFLGDGTFDCERYLGLNKNIRPL